MEPGYGGYRIYSERLELSIKPKFKLGSNPSIFAAGSCFAREIELSLHTMGLQVLSWNPTMQLSNAYFHRYNTFSIINDFQFAYGRQYDENNILQIGGEKFSDYSGYGVETSAEAVLAKRREIVDVYRRAGEADLLIVTLGLVEAWYDKLTETYLNTSPYHLLARHGDRFELRVTGYEDNKRALQDLIALIRANKPDAKILLTVSPVPFSDTFSGQDVVIANTYSKSVLRAVAQALSEQHAFVDYFPSYEMVMLSDPASAWLADHRHVRRDHVNFIVTQFVENYLTSES